MSQIILHYNGAYNLYSTISDNTIFYKAVTLDQLTEYIKEEYGRKGLEALPARLERAHALGSSGYNETLEECISVNRAGKNEKRLQLNVFIKELLTLDQ